MRTALVELHVHLDGSLNLPWAYQVAKRVGSLTPDETFEDFNRILYRTDYKTREEGFRKYSVTCDCMQTEQDLHDSVMHLAKELEELGLLYVEIRFAPQQHCLKGLSQEQAVAAVVRGIEDAAKAYPGVMIKLINCLMHKGNSAACNDKENRETIAVTKKFLPGGIVVGIDLAGYENNCPFSEYGYLFEIARNEKVPYTMHAAEMGSGIHINDALDFGAKRIGHGIDCIQNPDWLKRVVDSGVTLEVCVTSNCRHGVIRACHPIRALLDAGVKVTLNSDNMMFAETCLSHEHLLLKRIGVTEEQLMQTTYNAIDAAFCSEQEKMLIRSKVDAIYGRKDSL